MISTIGSTTSIIRAFASNSYKGLYTEENYSHNLLVLNVAPPSYAKISKDFFWPSCSIFGIYDGHNGKKCSEYLRENLHQNILRSEHFPKRMENAITSGFELTDRNFIREKGLSIGRDILKLLKPVNMFCLNCSKAAVCLKICIVHLEHATYVL